MTPRERAFVWAGGALFVAALAASAWAFAFTWAAPIGAPPSGPVRAVLADVLLITLFAAHHSLFAREPAKAAVARLVPAHLVRSVYVWTASVLLILTVSLWQPIGGVIYETGFVVRSLQVLMQLAGLWFTIWGYEPSIRSSSRESGRPRTAARCRFADLTRWYGIRSISAGC